MLKERKERKYMSLWTYEHAVTLLPAVVVFALISFGLRVLLKNKSRAVRMIPVQVIAVILLLLEAGKQGLSFKYGYDLYHIPLHFCSLFLYVIPAFAFYKGKYSRTVGTIAATLCSSVFLLMMIYPNLIYGDFNIRAFFTDFFSFHTVVFHNLVVLLLFLILALDLYTPEKGKEVWAPAAFMLCYSAIAAPLAQILRTNYNNFYSCNIPPLESLRMLVQNGLGYWPAQIMYVLIVVALDVGFVMLARFCYLQTHRLLHRVPTKKI